MPPRRPTRLISPGTSAGRRVLRCPVHDGHARRGSGCLGGLARRIHPARRPAGASAPRFPHPRPHPLHPASHLCLVALDGTTGRNLMTPASISGPASHARSVPCPALPQARRTVRRSNWAWRRAAGPNPDQAGRLPGLPPPLERPDADPYLLRDVRTGPPGSEHHRCLHPDPPVEGPPLRGQTLRIPHAPGIPRRSPIVSPYDNTASMSAEGTDGSPGGCS